MNEIIQLGDNPKAWLLVISALLISLIVGRFVQAFKNGEGIKGAVMAVWLGTNEKSKTDV